MPDQDFTALCTRKAAQIGKPVGLLVENDAGALAAVHNLGRVTWLDDCVQGPVAPTENTPEGNGLTYKPDDDDGFDIYEAGTHYIVGTAYSEETARKMCGLAPQGQGHS